MATPTEADRIMPLDATRDEIDGTPAAMSRALEALAPSVRDLATALALRRIARVAIIGSGDSLAVGMMAAGAFAQFARRQLDAVQAYEFATYGYPDFGGDRAAILISSSGRPSPVRDALTRALTGDAFVIGVSDRAGRDNPFLSRPAFSLCPGAAKRGMPTQSTSVTLALLLRLSIEWGQILGHVIDGTALEELLIVPKRLAFIAQAQGKAASAIGVALGDWRRIHIVGAGPNVGTAEAAALLFAAGPGLAAVAHSVEEIHHALKLATLGNGDLVLVLAPREARAERLLAETVGAAGKRGAHVIVLGTSGLGGAAEIPLPRTLEALSPLLMLPVLQRMALSAALSVADNATLSFRTRPFASSYRAEW